MKKSTSIPVLKVAIILCLSHFVHGQHRYLSHDQLEQQLLQLNQDHPSLSRLESIAETPGGSDIRVLTIGKGDVDKHPGMVIVSGVDGSHISSPVLAVNLAETLLSQAHTDSISALLDSVTFYIIPNMSPDATEQYEKAIIYERKSNDRPTDDDRDGRLNEDPFEDLNEDGMITMVRIKDPTGKWVTHEEDDRVMVKSDKSTEEKGRYILITEGIDNDKDGKFNEDGEGGIIFNKNLPFKFEHFKPGSGEFPVSEPESRGLLDYLYEKWNVFAVFTFGPADNLSNPLPYKEKEATAEIITGIQEDDAMINAMVSEKYNEFTGKKTQAELSTIPGGFMQWAYFHFGRLSFSTPAFFVPEIKTPADSAGTNAKKKPEFHPEVNFLKWADSVLTEPYFADWMPIEHPDFPGQEAEVGGFYPYVKNNPPQNMVDSISGTHAGFIVWLAALHPRIEIMNLHITDLGDQVFRVEIDVYNSGIIPVMTGIGEKTRWVKKPKVSLDTDDDQIIISGKKITLLEQLKGDSKHSLRWLIQGKGVLKIEVGAPQAGIQVKTIDLN